LLGTKLKNIIISDPNFSSVASDPELSIDPDPNSISVSLMDPNTILFVIFRNQNFSTSRSQILFDSDPIAARTRFKT
jgi:hypothetical protein